MNGKKVLFCSPLMADMAQVVTAGADIAQAKIDWEVFHDGWPNLFIRDIRGYRGYDAYFLAAFRKPADIFAQLGVIYALPRYEVGSLTIFLPFFSTGTMERIEKEGEIATAMSLARMLDAIPDGGPGFGRPRVVIYDIHALGQRFYFHNVLPRLETAIPLLLPKLDELKRNGEEAQIAFPDSGAQKRLGILFQDFEQIICTKIREGDKRIVRIKEGDPAGRHVVIIDDLVQTGGTLIECCRALRSRGAMKVSAFATHGIFPNGSWHKFIDAPESEAFDNFWLTDSCPRTAKRVDGRKPFRILSLAPLIRDSILNDNV